MAKTGARILVPPSSSEQTEITISGEKDGVFAAKQKIEEIYQEMVII